MRIFTPDGMWRQVVICIHDTTSRKVANRAFPVGMEVCFMTLQAQEGLILLQEVVCHGPVGFMTLKAAF